VYDPYLMVCQVVPLSDDAEDDVRPVAVLLVRAPLAGDIGEHLHARVIERPLTLDDVPGSDALQPAHHADTLLPAFVVPLAQDDGVLLNLALGLLPAMSRLRREAPGWTAAAARRSRCSPQSAHHGVAEPASIAAGEVEDGPAVQVHALKRQIESGGRSTPPDEHLLWSALLPSEGSSPCSSRPHRSR
jgi:hypothetical protein